MYYMHIRYFSLLLLFLIKLKRAFPMHVPTPPSEKCYNSLEGLSCIDSACLLDTYTLACKHWTSQFKNYFFPLSI